MEKDKIFIYGAGGFGKVICDILTSNGKSRPIAFVDNDSQKKEWYGLQVVPPTSLKEDSRIILAIGNNRVRSDLWNTYATSSNIESLIEESVFISKTAAIGKGCIILPYSCINANVKIGNSCILNAGCTVDHDAQIGDFVHLRHNVVINASVKIEDYCFIGENCVIDRGVMLSAGTKVPPNTWVAV